MFIILPLSSFVKKFSIKYLGFQPSPLIFSVFAQVYSLSPGVFRRMGKSGARSWIRTGIPVPISIVHLLLVLLLIIQ